MRYFKDNTNQVYGYDESNPTQLPLIEKAIAAGWTEITGSWPPAETDAQLKAACKAQAQSLLQATDWATLADVTTSTPKLTNQADFLTYRSAVRALAINPVTNPVFPVMPTDIWA